MLMGKCPYPTHPSAFHIQTIAAWCQQKYHEMPEHEGFKQLLQAPKIDAEVHVPLVISFYSHKPESKQTFVRLTMGHG